MSMTPETPEPELVPWPNQHPVVDGVTPVSEVPQDPDLFANDTADDLDKEMD